MKILLIEDDEQTIEAIQLCLATFLPEAKLTSVRQGADGLLELKAGNFDSVLLDLGLPDMDGLQLLKELRKVSNTPVIVISARRNLDIIAEARECGAAAYITKPFDNQLLLKQLREQSLNVAKNS
jgi:two-component system KDP operon response regulator KdpE